MRKIFSYERIYRSLDTRLDNFFVQIYAYDGEGTPDWLLDETGHVLPNFRPLCTLMADLSGLEKLLEVQKGSEGQDIRIVFFKVHVLFGGTALEARLTWDEGVSVSHFHL